jgi:hypothetical protein
MPLMRFAKKAGQGFALPGPLLPEKCFPGPSNFIDEPLWRTTLARGYGYALHIVPDMLWAAFRGPWPCGLPASHCARL